MSEYRKKVVSNLADESDLSNLSNASIFRIAWDIQEQTHDPSEAKLLLHKFCELFAQEKEIPYQLLRHLNDAFCDFLNGRAELDTALGLTPGKRRPKYDRDFGLDVCVFIWKARLARVKAGFAKQDAISEFGGSENVIDDMWKKYRYDAFILLHLELKESGLDLTEDQIKIADRILAKDRKRNTDLLDVEFTPEK